MVLSNVWVFFLLVGGAIATILLMILVGIWRCLFCYFTFKNWIFLAGFLILFFLTANLVLSSIWMILFFFSNIFFAVFFYITMLFMYCMCSGALLFFSVVWISSW